MDMKNKMSALKRFQCLSESMCSPTSLSFLTDVRCNLDFDMIEEDDENVLLAPESTPTLERTNKRKRMDSIYIEELIEDSYESPSKLIKLDHNEVVKTVDNNMIVEEQTIPTVKGYHSDLKYITTQTLEMILNKERNTKEVIIIDCRYPYEYEGGHIKGAMNLYTREMIQNTFIEQNKNINNSILVFHCEFSSERGPKMCRYLREQDRSVHIDCYPQLYYPDMYVLQGGYKSFYEQCTKEFCEPQQYRPMIHPAFNTQLKHYRKETKKWKRSKSWSGRSAMKVSNISTLLSLES